MRKRPAKTTAPAKAQTAPVAPAAPAAQPITIPLDVECDTWQTALAGGQLVVLLRRGGEQGHVIGVMRFHPRGAMQFASKVMEAAAKLDPKLTRFPFGG